jgi:dolichol-phosphate mannosyltransferase
MTPLVDAKQEPLVSIVVPIFDEAPVIDELYRRLTAALAGAGDYELLFVDDASRDESWERLSAHAATDSRVRLVRLSRNFGHQLALTAGLDAARGDVVVTMDGDLQHPPEAIPTLLVEWRKGYDVVHGVRTEPGGATWFKRVTARVFYRLMGRVSPVVIPEQAGDFRLLSRRAVDALARMPERARFLRGMASWIGFRQTTVPYREEPRFAGTTKWPPRRMLGFAADALTSFSTMPLRLVSALGFVVVLLCGAYLVYTLYVRLFTDDAVEGWTSVIVVVLLLGGVQLLSLGIVGQYIARIFEEAKGRPLYLVDEVVEAGETRPGETATPERRDLPVP